MNGRITGAMAFGAALLISVMGVGCAVNPPKVDVAEERRMEEHRRICREAQSKPTYTAEEFVSCDMLAIDKREAEFQVYAGRMLEKTNKRGVDLELNYSEATGESRLSGRASEYGTRTLIHLRNPQNTESDGPLIASWYYELAIKQNYLAAYLAKAEWCRAFWRRYYGPCKTTSFEYRRQAAILGHEPTQKELIPQFLESGFPAQETMAFAWLEALANGGDIEAEKTLVGLLDASDGRFEDRQRALGLIKKLASEDADPVAMRLLGQRYESGDGVMSDVPIALDWYSKAALRHDREASTKVVKYYEQGGNNAELVRSAVVASYENLAIAGETDAMVQLAIAYEDGKNVQKSVSQAFEWYAKAAQDGNVGAQYRVAEMHFRGNGTAVDLDAARNWMTKAADGNHKEARRRLPVIEHELILRDVSAADRTALQELGVVDAGDYGLVVNRMNQSGYVQGSELSSVLAFLRDEQTARRTGSSALALRQERVRAAEAQRLQRMRLAAEAQRRKDEALAREYPFIAIFTCGLDGDHHINIFVCFAPSGHSRGTQLELMTGNIHSVYQGHNLRNSGGRETRDGFHIDLPMDFHLRAQNASDGLMLGLRIIDRASGEVLLQRQATQYRVVEARN